MTFDAGSIEATFDVDRTPFQQGLAAAKREGEEFAKRKFTATLDLDLDRAGLKARMAELERGLTVHARVVVDQDRKTDEGLRRTEQSLSRVRTEATKAGQAVESDLKNPLIDLGIVAGPGLLPLAGGLAGILAGMVGIGTVGVLAIKGAKKEMDDFTRTGQRYTATIDNLTSSADKLERTAAKGVVGSFEKIGNELTRQTPQLNSFIAKISGPAGDAITHIANGILHLFTAAEPLIETAITDIDRLVTKFDNWAQGPAGAKFFAELGRELPIAIDAIGHIAGIIGHIVAGLEPVGEVVLHIIDGVATFIDAIGQPATTAIVTFLVAWRANALLTALSTKLLGRAAIETAAATTVETRAIQSNTLALIENIAAARGAAIARGGLAASGLAGWGAMRVGTGAGAPVPIPVAGATGVRGLLGGILPYAKGALALGLGAYVGSNITRDWKGRDNWQSAIHGGFDVVKDTLRAPFDLITGNPGKLWNDVWGDTAADDRTERIAQSQRDYNKWANSGLARMNLPYGQSANLDKQLGRSLSYTANTVANVTSGSNLEDAQAANSKLTDALQKRIETEQKLFDTSKGQIVLNNGLAVSSDAYDAALKKFGNEQDVTKFFENHALLLNTIGDDQDNLVKRGENYNTFLATAATKNKLTTAQVQAFSSALGLNYEEITRTKGGAEKLGNVVAEAAEKFRNGTPVMQEWLATVGQIDTSSTDLSTKVALLGAGLKALQGNTLDMAGANLNAVSATESAANAIEKNSASLDKNGRLLGQLTKTADGYIVKQPKLTEGALAIQQAMAGAGQQAITLAQSIYANTGSADKAADAYYGLKRQFYLTEIQAGRSATAAANLANEIFGVPDKKFTEFLSKGDLPGAIRNLTKKLGDFTKQFSEIAVTIGVKEDPALEATIRRLVGLSKTGIPIPVKPTGPKLPFNPIIGANPPPTGGGGAATGYVKIREGTTSTADDVWIRASKGESIINAEATAKHEGLLRAINDGAPGFKDGTVPSLITDSGGGGSGSSKSRLSSLLDKLLSDYGGLGSIATMSAGEVRRATTSILTDIKKLFNAGYVKKSTVTDFRNDTDRLVAEVKRRDALLKQIGNPNLPHKMDEGERLDAITNLTSSISGGVLGQFDIGSSGNGYGLGILESLQQSNRDAKKFDALRSRAKALGLRKDLIEKITTDYADNPEAAARNLQAIVGGGSDYVKRLNSTYASFKTTAATLGNEQARDTYGRTQAEELKYIRKLMEHARDASKAANADLKEIRTDVHELDKRLTAAARQG